MRGLTLAEAEAKAREMLDDYRAELAERLALVARGGKGLQ